MRNDFSPNTKELIAKRVGYRCSNPNCRQFTCGPQEDQTKTVNVGVAAHITAASPNGPRFNGALTSDVRKSTSNGIWLCQKCAKLVDNDPQRYSIIILNQWKKNAEDEAIKEIEGHSISAIQKGKPYVRFTDELDIEFRAPTIVEFIAMLPQYFKDDTVGAGKITEMIKLLSSFEQYQLCQNLRMTCLKLSIQNVGNELSRDIKLFWDKNLFFTYDSLIPGEKTKSDKYLFGNLSMSVRDKEGVASAIAPPKNLDFWKGFIRKIQEMSKEGKRIGSDLEIIYKIHRRKIPILLQIDWKDLDGKEYKNIAQSNLFWNGSYDQIEPWEYNVDG